VETGNRACFPPSLPEHRCHHPDQSGSGMYAYGGLQTADEVGPGEEASAWCPVEGAETEISGESKSESYKHWHDALDGLR
jgi:hypothetical protein